MGKLQVKNLLGTGSGVPPLRLRQQSKKFAYHGELFIADAGAHHGFTITHGRGFVCLAGDDIHWACRQ